MNGIDVLIHKYPMELNFKTFLEENDEPDEAELTADAQRANASLKPPFKQIPEYLDPDEFYDAGYGGIFTFLYSVRDYDPPGLVLAHNTKSHGRMIGTQITMRKTNRSAAGCIAGRYGIYEQETPIVTVWSTNSTSLLKEALQVMWAKRLLHPQTLLFKLENKGLVRDFIFGRVPDEFKAQINQEVDIMGKKYSLQELPMFLHTLPASSKEHRDISAFICANLTKYPILKNFAYKAKCGETQPLFAPKMTLQQRQLFNTSESHLDK